MYALLCRSWFRRFLQIFLDTSGLGSVSSTPHTRGARAARSHTARRVARRRALCSHCARVMVEHAAAGSL